MNNNPLKNKIKFYFRTEDLKDIYNDYPCPYWKVEESKVQ